MQDKSLPPRHYGMDWLRIGAFGLLIFYHIGMFFVPWSWHVKAQPVLDWVAVPMLATNAWRLSLLFLASGYASAAILERRSGPGAFVAERSARLLPPLLFGMAVIVPPQPWVELVTQHGYAADYSHFWLHDYFRFAKLEGIALPTWQHLWFVVYLWLYTLALGLLLCLPQRVKDFAARAGAAVLGQPLALLLVPIAWIAMLAVIVFPGAPEKHDVVSDLPTHLVYFPMLMAGFALRRCPAIFPAVRAVWPWALALGVASYAVVAGIEIRYPGATVPPDGVVTTFRAARAVQAWGMILGLVGLADRYWNRDHPWRATLNEGVFPFYIVHQTLIVLAGYACLRAGLSNAITFPLMVLATAGGCWLFYLVARRAGPLRVLAGLRTQRPAS